MDPTTAPIVKGIFESSLRGNGLKEICRELNDRGITNRGKRWYKGGLHYLLTNEAYTGTAVWGRTSKGEKPQDPVRVEGAWPALVSRELFNAVQEAMRDRAPKVQRPARVGSKFLLSGLLKCGVCGRPYRAQGAKSGQFSYYICGTLFTEGAGTCSARYLNAPRLKAFVVEKIRERILTEETIVELVTMVAEEIDAMAGELSGRLEVVEAELGDVRKRLEKLYEAIETSELTLKVLSPRILSLRHREEQLEAERDDAERQLEQRRVELPDHGGDQGVCSGLPRLPGGREYPRVQGAHPQLRGGHRGGGRRGYADVHHPRFSIDTKNCGSRGGWTWMPLGVVELELAANPLNGQSRFSRA